MYNVVPVIQGKAAGFHKRLANSSLLVTLLPANKYTLVNRNSELKDISYRVMVQEGESLNPGQNSLPFSVCSHF